MGIVHSQHQPWPRPFSAALPVAAAQGFGHPLVAGDQPKGWHSLIDVSLVTYRGFGSGLFPIRSFGTAPPRCRKTAKTSPALVGTGAVSASNGAPASIVRHSLAHQHSLQAPGDVQIVHNLALSENIGSVLSMWTKGFPNCWKHFPKKDARN